MKNLLRQAKQFFTLHSIPSTDYLEKAIFYHALPIPLPFWSRSAFLGNENAFFALYLRKNSNLSLIRIANMSYFAIIGRVRYLRFFRFDEI